MNPSHYPSLELSKKLTEIGFTEIGFTYCPSVMEMLDVIPKEIVAGDEICYLTIDYGANIVYYESGRGASTTPFVILSFPNALAEMIIWLHEKNYISLDTIQNKTKW